jgi:hypothetical protein
MAPAYDETNLILYVNISQIFSIWIIPFHRAPVNLTSVLKLHHNRGDDKYYIASQNDLYQVDEFVKFVLPPGWILVWLWQFWATFFCLLGAFALQPVTWVEQQIWDKGGHGKRTGRKDGGMVNGEWD